MATARLLKFVTCLSIFHFFASQSSGEKARIPLKNPHCNQVITSSPAYNYDLFVSALFLKPSCSNLNYAAEAIPLPLPSPNWNIFEIHPQYYPSFDVGIKGIFHKHDTNLMLMWQRFKSSHCATTNVGPQNMIGPFFEIGPDATPYNQATGKVTFSFDEVNLDGGKFVHFGDDLSTNLFGGLSFVRIKENLCSTFVNSDGSITRTVNVPSSFIGAGPQFGFEGSYCLSDRVLLASKSLISLLAGKLRNHTTFSSTSPALAGLNITPPNVQHICVQNSFAVVPVFEQKIGLSYVISDQNHEMKISAGYRLQLYINALQSVDMGSEVINVLPFPGTVGVFARTFQRTIHNFALAGPYLTFDFGY
jgi:hypothetical protein